MIVRGMPIREYHDHPAWSSSQVNGMDCPAKVIHAKENPRASTDNMVLGSAIHKFILERESFDSEFLTGISAGRRSNADRKAWADWYAEHGADGDAIIERPASEWNAEFERQTGFCMVTPETIDMIRQMADSISQNKNAIQLLADGEAETSMFWTDDETGLDLKCRPDYLNADFVSDLKSCASVSNRGITRAIADFGYGISQAMYQDGIRTETGDWRPFLFIFIEKTPPYLCRVIALDDTAQEAVWMEYKSLLRRLGECSRSGEWPGYTDNLTFTMPQWYLGG